MSFTASPKFGVASETNSFTPPPRSGYSLDKQRVAHQRPLWIESCTRRIEKSGREHLRGDDSALFFHLARLLQRCQEAPRETKLRLAAALKPCVPLPRFLLLLSAFFSFSAPCGCDIAEQQARPLSAKKKKINLETAHPLFLFLSFSLLSPPTQTALPLLPRILPPPPPPYPFQN